jgi:drug/metabolite transporter (DMT)-like permease
MENLAVIFAIGMSGLLLYNFGLRNAHPIIISAILNLSPFLGGRGGAADIQGSDSGLADNFLQLLRRRVYRGNGGRLEPDRRRQQADDQRVGCQLPAHGSWVYAIPVPLCSALGGTLIGRWFAKYEESAAIASNFLVANVVLIPATLFLLYLRSELQFDQIVAIILMIIGTIVAASVGRVFYQIALTVTGADNGFVTMFFNLVPALTALISLLLSWRIADLHFAADPMFFLGSALIAVSLLLFSLKSWRQPPRNA